jgi:trans-aconitate methyltransferase
MSDPVLDLYQSRSYQAMSHPSTDPAITAVAARLAGLDVPAPAGARVLEIGCAAGHNLLPLAARWPESRFVGIDFSTAAIKEARETAGLAGLANVDFIETDLRTYDPGAGVDFDFIIAHGVYSWVPDEVRRGLMELCAAKLSPRGVALISYNTLPGWSLRKTLVGLTNRLAATAEVGGDPEEILAFLATVAGNHTPYARYLTSVLHAMFGKGANSLSFDDFAPVNEPCTFIDFANHASRSGLRYLGESQLVEDLPASLAPGSAEILKPLAKDPLALQQTIDVLANRTFRRSLLCRADAPVLDRINPAIVLNFSVRNPNATERLAGGVRLLNHDGNELARFDGPLAVAFFSVLAESRLESVPVREVLAKLADVSPDPTQCLLRLVVNSARRGLVMLRDEPVRFDTSIPEFPNLGPLRLIAAGNAQPMADLYHSPCHLDENCRMIALAMDGSRPVEELAALAKTIAPKLDFQNWLGHLAARGMFTA